MARFNRVGRLRGGFLTPSVVVPKVAQFTKTHVPKMAGTPFSKFAPAVGYFANRWSNPKAFAKDAEFIKTMGSGVKTIAKNLFNPESRVKGPLSAPIIFSPQGTVTRSDYILGKALRYKNKLDQKFVLQQQDSFNLVCSTGTQAVEAYGVLDAYFLSKLFIDLANSDIGGTTSVADLSSRFYVDSVNTTYRFINSGNMGLLLNIYQCEPTKYTVRTNTQSQDAYVLNPKLSWESGTLSQGPDGFMHYGGAPSITNIAARPFNVEAFNQFWRVREIQRVELTAGSTHIHNAVYNINNIFHAAELLPGVTSALGSGTALVFADIAGSIPGFTKYIMITISGVPVHSSSNIDQVSTAQVALDIVRTQDVKVRTTFNNSAVIATKNNLPDVSTPEQVTVQSPVITGVIYE